MISPTRQGARLLDFVGVVITTATLLLPGAAHALTNTQEYPAGLQIRAGGRITFTAQAVAHGAGAAIESGADSAASQARVLVQGAAAISESGTDTAAGIGAVRISGVGAAVESGADSAGATGRAWITGAGAVTEAPDIAGGSGKVLVAGVGAAIESGTDSVLGQGRVVIPPTLGILKPSVLTSTHSAFLSNTSDQTATVRRASTLTAWVGGYD